jgi:hypothetical protein
VSSALEVETAPRMIVVELNLMLDVKNTKT